MGDAGRKVRIDALLVERGLAETRSRAQAFILAGRVYRGEARIEKPGQRIDADSPITVRGRPHPWVSRGGLKLAHALDHFGIDPKGKIALDLGASTGGFTEVLLSAGAARVYSIDVGRGQFDWRLRNDPRVVLMERTNARYLSSVELPEPVEIIVCDVSFIGLETLLPASLELAAAGALLVSLIKPQFEVGKGLVGKGGIVRDPALHEAVCQRIKGWINARPGWRVLGLSESPIEGAGGNKEFLIAAVRNAE
jgi:23S rRNA (cytidine1920-2'-O)/16S rRNA (cytidine1409-2'-O)-methyltransferase